MRTYFDCVPCFIRQTLDALRLVSADEAVAERALRQVLQEAAGMRMDRSPPFMGRQLHRIIREVTGRPDPYAEIKRRSTATALGLAGDVSTRIADAGNSFAAAVRFAIAGNVMDFAIASLWDGGRIQSCIEEAPAKPLDLEEMAALERAVAGADSILYLGDNAGETVFDRLLIEQMPRGRVTYVVKGSPVINDATLADAEAAGLQHVARIIDNGSDAPGTILELCRPEFRVRFEEADVVLAKGQANYETLCDADRPVFFLTQIKCPIVATDLAGNVGDWVVARNHGAQPGCGKDI